VEFITSDTGLLHLFSSSHLLLTSNKKGENMTEFRTRKDGTKYPISDSGKEYHRDYDDYPRSSKNIIKYHDREGHVKIHMDEKGRKYIMVRAKGGGTKRLYEGQKYRPNKKSKETKVLVLD